MKTYKGSCHCGRIQYEVDTDLAKTLVCNCSHCHKKGFILHFVDAAQFRLVQGTEVLTSYMFNKKSIDHLFCSVCGIESFARGVTFPKVAINVRCLEDVDIESLAPERFNGKDL